MKINKIKLYNFSSYEGENIIDFSIIDNKKNIILIGGKNGAGKTSLFTAIKVALYGPLAYGYVGANSYYISRIKGLINSKAFQQDKVEAGVQITVSLKMQGEIKEYVITRKWYYLKQKLYENYYVENEKGKLSEQELSYFQNYLQSIVPPDLFEFFLFDGEEVGKIFATSSYNTYVKNAVFTLCGMDVFEILRKYTNGYVAKSLHEDDKKLHIEYDEVKSEVERLEIRKQGLLGDIDEVQTVLKDLEIQLIELETAFKNAGGINKKEREILEAQYKEAEIKKSESSAKIKLFVEGMMPFLIIKGMTSTLSNQLEIEEKSSIYNYLSNTVKERDALYNEEGKICAEISLPGKYRKYIATICNYIILEKEINSNLKNRPVYEKIEMLEREIKEKGIDFVIPSKRSQFHFYQIKEYLHDKCHYPKEKLDNSKTKGEKELLLKNYYTKYFEEEFLELARTMDNVETIYVFKTREKLMELGFTLDDDTLKYSIENGLNDVIAEINPKEKNITLSVEVYNPYYGINQTDIDSKHKYNEIIEMVKSIFFDKFKNCPEIHSSNEYGGSDDESITFSYDLKMHKNNVSKFIDAVIKANDLINT